MFCSSSSPVTTVTSSYFLFTECASSYSFADALRVLVLPLLNSCEIFSYSQIIKSYSNLDKLQ